MQHAVEQAIAIGLEEDVGIRSGLPINYLSFLGTGKNMDQYVEGKRYTRHWSRFWPNFHFLPQIVLFLPDLGHI